MKVRDNGIVECVVCGDPLTVADRGAVCRQCTLVGVTPERKPTSKRGVPSHPKAFA
jgi:hypothetical protein